MKETSLYFELTSHCNLRCPYCFNFSNEGPVRQWHMNEIAAVVQSATQRLRLKELVLSGGEALLHPAWREVVKQGRGLGLPVGLISNGIAITDDVVQFLLEHDVSVTVSLGGTSEEEDAPLRGRNVFHRTLKGLATFQRHGLKPGLVYIVHKQNLDSMERALALADEYGAAWVRFGLIQQLGRAERHWQEIGVSLMDRLRFMSQYIKHSASSKVPCVLEVDPNLHRALHGRPGQEGSLAPSADAGTVEVCIRYDGRVELAGLTWESWERFLEDAAHVAC